MESNIIFAPTILSDGARSYQFLGLLGEGGQARVFKYQDMSTKICYAVKQIRRKPDMEDFPWEAFLLSNLEHDNIVKAQEVIEKKHYVYLVQELCSESLEDLLSRRGVLTEPEVKYYLYQAIQGLQFCHDNMVLHRDIKPDNLFLQGTQIKIGDFGLSIIVGPEDLPCSCCGTLSYMAPEVVKRKDYSLPADIWSLGVTMYRMLFGTLPFDEESDSETSYRIVNALYWTPKDRAVSDQAVDLLSKMLRKYPEHRPTCEEILDHPFFTSTPAGLPKEPLCIIPTKLNSKLEEESVEQESFPAGQTSTNTEISKVEKASEKKSLLGDKQLPQKSKQKESHFFSWNPKDERGFWMKAWNMVKTLFNKLRV